MKVNDYGTTSTSTNEKQNSSISPQEIEAQLELINKKIINNPYVSQNGEENSKDLKNNKIRDKIKPNKEKNHIEENKNLKSNFNSKINFNNNINLIKYENNDINYRNGIKNIDFDKNIIVINKQNLKEYNNINKESKNEKRNDNSFKKGETVNIFIKEIFNYNKDVSNLIQESYEYLSENFYDYTDNSWQIKNSFPDEVIEKFFEKKKSKIKEKNILNYISFGNNPLETLKDTQGNLLNLSPNPKNGKTSVKQFKINQKNLKEQNNLLQKYIKSFPVFNCPETKFFKLNKCYIFNKINDDKDINIINNSLNKNIKIISNLNNSKDINESEEETIDRHLKNKFINKKRNKS